MTPLPKVAGWLATVLAVFGVLAASNSVTVINNLMSALGVGDGAQHAVGVALGIIGSIVTLFSHSATGTGGAPPVA